MAEFMAVRSLANSLGCYILRRRLTFHSQCLETREKRRLKEVVEPLSLWPSAYLRGILPVFSYESLSITVERDQYVQRIYRQPFLDRIILPILPQQPNQPPLHRHHASILFIRRYLTSVVQGSNLSLLFALVEHPCHDDLRIVQIRFKIESQSPALVTRSHDLPLPSDNEARAEKGQVRGDKEGPKSKHVRAEELLYCRKLEMRRRCL